MASILTKTRVSSVSAGSAGGRKRRRRNRLLWLAGALMLFGIVAGLGGPSESPEKAAAESSEEQAVGKETQAAAPVDAVHKPALPATFRLGAGYAGGFLIGWLFRRFIRIALLVTGALVGLIALARGFGWFEADWASMEGSIRESLAWLTVRAGSFKDLITGYLPSAGAATLGVIFGLRSA